MRSKTLAWLLLTFILAAPRLEGASGTYPGKPSGPPTTVDADRYHRGKQIFTGKANLGAPIASSTPQQEARLNELQTLLPRQAQSATNLTALAGRLSQDSLEALEYYLAIRYKIKTVR